MTSKSISQKMADAQVLLLKRTADLQAANRDLARVEKWCADAQLEAHDLRLSVQTLLIALRNAQICVAALERQTRGCKCGRGLEQE